jgi:HK97 family phage major capsid protein
MFKTIIGKYLFAYMSAMGFILFDSDTEIKGIVEKGLKDVQDKLETSIKKFEGQLEEKGKVDKETRDEVKQLSEDFASISKSVTELAQKQAEGFKETEVKTLSVGEEFVGSDEFKQFTQSKSRNGIIRLEMKNTILADNTTTFAFQRQGVIPLAPLPLTIRDILPSMQVTTNMVNSLREDSFTNDAAFVAQGAAKPESDIVFEPYNIPIETVAHWLKVSNQLLADAPAVAAYINLRLRDGIEQKIDSQLLLGDGTTPNLSGLTDAGNFTAYTATAGDNLIDAISRAKYQLWALGYTPDAVIVNPADWGAMEIAREGVGTGAYLYGTPGQVANNNPFGLRIVLSNNMPAGSFMVGAFNRSTMLYNRQGTTVEMGYVNDDFTKNLVTIRAEARLGLAVEVPAGILYGEFTAVAP